MSISSGEGIILRAMGGDVAEAAEEKTGLDLRMVLDPEPFFTLQEIRRIAKKMGKGYETRLKENFEIIEKRLLIRDYTRGSMIGVWF